MIRAQVLPAVRVALGVVLGLAGCRGSEVPQVAGAKGAVSVQTSVVQRAEIVEPVLGTGSIAAEKTTEIGPRVDGIIDEIYVKVGDAVEAGQPLFRTRTVDYEIAVRRAEHALALARA